MKGIKRVFLIFVVIFLSLFNLSISSEYNEMDVMAYSYSIYRPDWLINDWYLSLQTEYRYLFGFITGFFVAHFGFIPTIFIGRLITYCLFSYAYNLFLIAAKINYTCGILSLFFFLNLFNQNLGSGEWIIGGYDTKAFAYTCVIFSIAFFLKKKYALFLFFSGLALSFHLLVGGYHFICMAPVIFQKIKNKEIFLLDLIKSSYIYLLTGMMGFYGFLNYFLDFSSGISSLISAKAWEIYVFIRVPHHVLPYWGLKTYLLYLVIGTFNFYILLKTPSHSQFRLLSMYCLTSICLVLFGVIIFFFGKYSLLRFYFFRFADSILPLVTLPILIDFSFKIISNKTKKDITILLNSVAPMVIMCFFLFTKRIELSRLLHFENYSYKAIVNNTCSCAILADWIKNNTSENAMFLTPIDFEHFYLFTERSVLVTFKHSPQKSKDILEWYHRIRLLNKGQEISSKSFEVIKEVNRNYSKLNEAEIKNIKQLYSVNYIILPNKVELSFPQVFKGKKFTIYEIP